MMRTARHTLLPLLLVLTGCAGGWRGAPPAGYEPFPSVLNSKAVSSPLAAAATPAPASTAPKAAASKANDRITQVGAADATFRYDGAATSANVAGEFNAWSTSADPMAKRADGVWELKKPLAAGRYQYKFVLNGSEWKADAAAPETSDDGFGGKNSVVVVGGGGAAPAAPAAPAATKPAAGAGPSATAAGVVFRYSGAATSVNLAGEFNAWSTSADALTKGADGTWTITKKLDAGRYQYKFVIDGGTWKEDPNAAETTDDGYGGKNSVVVVGDGGAAPATPAAPAATKPAAAGAAPSATAAGVVFRYSGAANSVNLAGEFNAWSTSADALTKGADGTWTITKKLDAGRYQYKFVIDGGTWKEDPNAAETTDDGYGGKNAVVVVGGAAGGSATPAPPAAVAVTGKAKAPVVGADGVTFTYAGAARSVALAGDFNDWALAADPMKQQSDGTWTITKKLAAGSHGYKFVVDGSTWKTDEANSASADDGFGGKNSVVVVK